MDTILIPMQDASKLTGLSKSTLYKLTSKRKISFYKPFGKKIFFSMEQLESMMKKNLVQSGEVLEAQAIDLLTEKHMSNGNK